MFRKWMSLLLCALLISVIGCSGSGGTTSTGQASESPPKVDESKVAPKVEAPAEFVMFTPSSLTPDDYQSTFGDLMSKKFPNTKFVQLIESNNNKLSQLITSGAAMDIAQYGITNSATFVDLDYPMDLDPLVKKFNYDLNRFDPGAIKEIRSYSANGELIALPHEYQPFVLYYNKDIFDKFGVPYPKVGSTWDELIELSRKLTRVEDGVQYKGLNPGLSTNRMQMQLSNPYVDPKTHKSLVLATPGWKKMFQTYLDIYSVPGNTPGNGTDEFLEKKILAMYPHLIKGISTATWAAAAKEGLRMGVTTYPVFKDAPNIGTGFFGAGLYIPKTSRNPDFAFQVIEYLLSDEVQILSGKAGRATALVNPNVQNALMQDNPLAKEVGFDISMVTKIKLAAPYQRTELDNKAASLVNKSITDVSTHKIDINTALREADDAVNQMLLDNPPKK